MRAAIIWDAALFYFPEWKYVAGMVEILWRSRQDSNLQPSGSKIQYKLPGAL
jgi:hypothetical protein